MYYKRLSPIGTFDAYGNMLETWRSASNTRGTDYDIYSSLSDAQAGTNPWRGYCNYDDGGVAFPRDCQPTSNGAACWNSLSRNTPASYRFSVTINAKKEGPAEPAGSPNTTAGNRIGNVSRMAVYSLSERRVGYSTKSKGRCERVPAEDYEWNPCTTSTTTTATTTTSVSCYYFPNALCLSFLLAVALWLYPSHHIIHLFIH